MIDQKFTGFLEKPIPATSVPTERRFSKSGQVTNDRRNRLPLKTLDTVIVITH